MSRTEGFAARRRSVRAFSLIVGSVLALAFVEQLWFEFEGARVAALVAFVLMTLLFVGSVLVWTYSFPSAGKRWRIALLLATVGGLCALAFVVASTASRPADEAIGKGTLAGLATAFVLTSFVVHFDLIHPRILDRP